MTGGYFYDTVGTDQKSLRNPVGAGRQHYYFDSASALFIAKELTGVLEEAEEFFLDGDPEE